ncbi:invasion associated locus B family protein [Devosia algicola]|uniref:Invasion associated locus B family protein n=1 Tax=Devosia algicola TaxID=3026418 RepID=A0ABY7YKE3_9HYPH|nr:invasion associated locus B family protein [Devosia algicola]WDR01726.1 invasion associated locus B family protein [Devosia algicola]
MTIKNLGLLIGLAVGGFMALAPNAYAQKAVLLGEFTAWNAWQSNDDTGMTCYISGVPQSSLPAGANRDPIHFIIINRKAMGIPHEVQTIIGYPFSTTKANASATVDGKSYPMVTEGPAAWLASTADEAPFVEAFKAGSKLVVKGTSQRGTTTTDTYSLSGATAAMNAMEDACK